MQRAGWAAVPVWLGAWAVHVGWTWTAARARAPGAAATLAWLGHASALFAVAVALLLVAVAWVDRGPRRAAWAVAAAAAGIEATLALVARLAPALALPGAVVASLSSFDIAVVHLAVAAAAAITGRRAVAGLVAAAWLATVATRGVPGVALAVDGARAALVALAMVQATRGADRPAD